MDHELIAVTEPASVVISLGALCALVAAFYWLRVVRVHTKGARPIDDSWSNAVRNAAAWTALALGLVSVGYLLGRLTGEF